MLRESKQNETELLDKMISKKSIDFKEKDAVSTTEGDPLCLVHPVTLLNTPVQ